MPDPTPQPHGEPLSRPGVDLDAVRALAEPLVRAHGLELRDVEWIGSSHGRVLRVVIDVPGGAERAGEGVSVDDCAAVSRDLGTALDAEEIVLPSYHLEVSSPGLDRPLRNARDFARQVGRLCKVKLVEPAPDGQRVLRGRLQGADDEGFRIEVDGKIHAVRLDNVQEAKLVFELGSQAKREKGSRRRARRR